MKKLLLKFAYLFKTSFKVIKEEGLKRWYNRVWLHILYYPSKPSLVKSFFRKLIAYYTPFPSNVEIEISTQCPYKCLICENTYWNIPGVNMPFEKFKYILDQFRDMKFVALTGIGENFLNEDFRNMRMYKYIKSRWPKCFLELYDNFFFVNEKIARELIELKIELAYVSLDAATKKTQEILRPRLDFDTVTSNARRFIRIKKESGRTLPNVIFHYVVSKQNVHEIVPYVSFVKELGGDSIKFTTMLHNYPEVSDYYLETIPQEIMEEANMKAKELRVAVNWNYNARPDKCPISECNLWLQPFVYVTGEVLPCCGMQEANIRDFQIKHSFGNVFEKPFKEIWYSKEFKKFRRDIKKGKIHPLCQDCPIFEHA